MTENERPFHADPVDEVHTRLDVDPDRGLSTGDARKRFRTHGSNKLREFRRRSVWRILVDQLKSLVLLILVAAGVLAFVFAQWAEGIAILAVLLVNTAIGFVSEWRARRSMEALRRMSRRKTRVRRDGSERTLATRKLVPGDIVVLEGGDLVPADLRIIEANGLRVNEAPLTGESVPVDKTVEPVEPDTPLAERVNMAYKGTTVVEGSGTGTVVATGMSTELGRIAELVAGADEDRSPLQHRLNQLGHRLAWITLGIAIVIAGIGLASGQPTLLMIETSIALGVAAIPEGLPIAATIALARGMWLMAQRQVLINRLPAVETLGATRIIVTDKTGTLTENRMRLQRAVTASGDYEIDLDAEEKSARNRTGEAAGPEDESSNALLQRLLSLGVLCNNASLGGSNSDEAQGDPTEIALLTAGQVFGIDRETLLAERPESREVAFDSDVMMMATFHEVEDGYEVAVKGAPDAVLSASDRVVTADGDERDLSDSERHDWLERVNDLAAEGLRVLALADRLVDNASVDPYASLRFVGLLGLLDPPRPQARQAVTASKRAGIRVIMATGDQVETARAIGRQVGIQESDDEPVLEGSSLDDPVEMSQDQRQSVVRSSIFARVTPEQKLHLIEVHQEEGETVAMTGDGVNDAPALKKADIGVAMGQRGTDAARQAADMVLKDDAFSSIVAAVEQGRIIFGNIRKAVLFMLCTNVAEVLAIAVASAIGAPLPLLPLQILYLNVLTDVLPAMALAVGEGGPGVMQRPPREPGESVLTREHWLRIGGWSTLMASCVLAGLALALTWLHLDRESAVTVSFLTLALAKLWFVFNLREPESGLLDNDVVRNPWIWAALAVCGVLLVAAVYVPFLSSVLKTHSPGAAGWSLALALSLLPFLLGQTARLLQGGQKGDAK